jgi:uncharacterized protein (TIGR02118 family)
VAAWCGFWWCTRCRATLRNSIFTIGGCTFRWLRSWRVFVATRSVAAAAAVRGGEPFYLVAELDRDDMDALRAAFASPEGQATARDVAELAPDGRVRSMIFELEDVSGGGYSAS